MEAFGCQIQVFERGKEAVGRRKQELFKPKQVAMKKITKEEAAKLQTKVGSSSAVRTAVVHLQVGEILLIEKADWTQQKGPGQMLSRLTERTKQRYKLSALADGSGWLVERVE